MKKIFFLHIVSCCFGILAALPSHAKGTSDTLLIPFGVKQSGIVHKYTLDVLDSVVDILKKNKGVTLSIQGYSYVDEGNDTVCKYLSLNRALFIRDAILGRGIDSSRISSVVAMGEYKPFKRGKYKVNNAFPYRVEILLIYPPPPKTIEVSDRDFDGIIDEEDSCADVFGYEENHGCPLKDVFYITFDNGQSYLTSYAYTVLEKVVNLVKANPAYTISVAGHASKEEGIQSVTDQLSKERTGIVVGYLSSRNFSAARITATDNYGKSKPVNAQRNPKEIIDNACVEIILNRHIP